MTRLKKRQRWHRSSARVAAKYYRSGCTLYGGIATADCLAASCAACLLVLAPGQSSRSIRPVLFATGGGREAGCNRAQKGVDQVRISGNEPTLCREHLLEVLQHIPKNLRFILETNGILIGHDPSYAKALAAFNNLHVRVSLKGASEEEFSRLTGARPKDFALQLAALENLLAAGVSVHPAVMISFSSERNIEALRSGLHGLPRLLRISRWRRSCSMATPKKGCKKPGSNTEGPTGHSRSRQNRSRYLP